LGDDEFTAGTAQFKNMRTQESVAINWHGEMPVLVDAVRSLTAAMQAG
jgi:hypothetical protein